MTLQPDLLSAAATPEAEPLSALLRAATHPTHSSLDSAIMAGKPFESEQNYARFVVVQHAFHADVAPLYADPALAALIPDLASLGRFDAVTRDLADLAQSPDPEAGAATPGADTAERLGWLYVVEGSNLGAAFLSKAANKLGFDDARGARHLAGAPEGRAAHWRAFKSGLDAAPLDAAGRERAVAGANAAFARVAGLVRRHLA